LAERDTCLVDAAQNAGGIGSPRHTAIAKTGDVGGSTQIIAEAGMPGAQ